MKNFTVADYLLVRLRQLDVEHVFQIPGDYVAHFTQALEKQGPRIGINAIGAANELDAAYAADGYARIRGLGAVSLQFGVSTFSALNAIAGAYVERAPVVVISASPSWEDRHVTNMYGVLYHHSTGNLNADQQVFEQVTVDSAMLDNAADAPEIIDRVLTSAITEKRPVYLAAFKEIWGFPCKPPGKRKLKPIKKESNPRFLEEAVEAAFAMIEKAEFPVIFAGVELLRFDLTHLLSKLIKKSGFLFTTTSLGKTVLSEKHKGFVGTYSDLAAVPGTLEVINKADCFITLGTIITDDYLDFISKDYGKMIRVDTIHSRVGWTPYPDVTMEDFMKELIKCFKKPDYPKNFKAPKPPKWPEPWVSNIDPKYAKDKDVLTYNRFFQHSMAFLHKHKMMDDIIMNFGISSAMYAGTNVFGLSQNSFIASAAWQCIGFGTGVALGVQLGSDNKKRAWTIPGDGGFMMICQSLSTQARNKLNAVTFVMSNGVYAIEQVYVNIKAFNPNKKGQPPFDNFDILADWDYVSLAKGFGAKGYRVTNVQELNECLHEIKDLKDVPALVEVVIPKLDLAGQMNKLYQSALQ
ncbi:MAG: thiamine pyrophosphate-binding protein [Bacteroidota bacterium]